MIPGTTLHYSGAIRRVSRLAQAVPAIGLLGLLGLLLTGPVALSAPAESHQAGIDTIKFRTAVPAPGIASSIDDNNARVGSASYPRDLIEWIAFGGPDHGPVTGPEVNRVDVVQLTNGTQVLGRIVSLTRDQNIVVDTGQTQSVPFSQVAAVIFCDTPCLVAPGMAVDPLVLSTESARISTGGGRVDQTPDPPTPVAALVNDPLASIRDQIQAPPPTVAPPTPTSPPTPTFSALPTPPAPVIIVTNTPTPQLPFPIPVIPGVTPTPEL